MSNLLFLKTRDMLKSFASSRDSRTQRRSAIFSSRVSQALLLRQTLRQFLSLMERSKVSRSFRQLMVTMLQELSFALSNLKALLQPDQTFINNRFKERLSLLPITSSLSNVRNYRLRLRTRLISWTCASRMLLLLMPQSSIALTPSISSNRSSCSITDRWTKGTTAVKDQDLKILIRGQWMEANILLEANLLLQMFNQCQFNKQTQCLLHRS